MFSITYSEAETETFGENLASRLNAGDCLALQGPLGSGKTALTRGICRGLQCTIDVSSPTFNIVNIYPGAIDVVHVDLYRIGNDIDSIGWDDLFTPEKIIIVEWAEKAKNYLPEHHIDVFFSIIDLNTREIKIEFINDSGN